MIADLNIDIKQYLITRYNLRFNNGIYIYGTGKLGEFAIKELSNNGYIVSGVLTNDKNIGENFCGIKIKKIEEVEYDALIVLCSSAYPIIRERLLDIGFKNTVYYEVLPFIDGSLKPYFMLYDMPNGYINKHLKEVNDVYDLLEDDTSKFIYEKMACYRMTLDDNYLDEAYLRSAERGTQYFDREIIKLGTEELFVDCGAYFGETSEEFISLCHNRCAEIYMFEPDRGAYAKMQENMQMYSNVRMFAAGCGEKMERLNFKNLTNGGSMVDDNGDEEIEIISLDELFNNKIPTYIKMDIEGSEKKAILGAQNIIRKHKPKLAICIYHRPEDFFEIPLLINKLNSNYRFYVRHYTRTYSDTVIYCV